MATEDFDRERLGRRVTFGLDSPIPAVQGWARDLQSALAEIERLWEALTTALADLDEEHQPTWSSDEAKARGKAPIGCTLCWPGDGHWPCSSRLIADDLRAALSGSSAGGEQ